MSEVLLRTLLDATARISFVFFFCAFTGPALANLQRTAISNWLSQKHDLFLVLLALSHTVHLSAIILLEQAMGWPAFVAQVKMATLIGGGLVYLGIYAMAGQALTRMISTAPPRNRPARIESVALYAAWAVFAAAFVPRIFKGWPVYTLLGASALLALVVRVAGMRRGAKPPLF
ncbi:MAG TPA: hypothetical protein VF532_02630 [Candidatus Angelobacter sp.]